MNRREFLNRSTGAVAASWALAQGFGQPAAASAGAGPVAGATPVEGTLTLNANEAGPLIPENYNGLSYELAQLTDPNFFAASNKQLIALFRLLSPLGVLRLGGNSSETCSGMRIIGHPFGRDVRGIARDRG